jgi:SAM-dependent methyltransferase
MERELYEQHAALEREQWWFVARRAILAAVLARYLPPDPRRRMLDIGCGTGGMLPMLSRFGSVQGLETDEGALDHCHASYSDFDVRGGRIPSDVPSDGTFDVVTAFDVVEHIADDVGAFRAMRAAIHPGGLAVVTVPALPVLWSQHDEVNGHQRRYTRASLLDVIDRSGFEPTHLSYFNTVLLPIVAAARLAQRLRPRRVAPHSDFTMPGATTNRILTRLMRSERSLVANRGLPLGVSLVAVAHRPA